MSNEADNQRALEKFKYLRSLPKEQISYTEIWSIAHALAEDQYSPAIEFFVAGLNDNNWKWRDDCIAFLGFHYPTLDKEIIDKFKKMLLHDPESSVRLTAAFALGKHSELPDEALLTAFEHDTNKFIRQAAFESILILAGVNHHKARKYGKLLKKEEFQSDVETIERILVEEGIKIPTEYITPPGR